MPSGQYDLPASPVDQLEKERRLSYTVAVVLRSHVRKKLSNEKTITNAVSASGRVLPVVTVRDFSASATCYLGSPAGSGQEQPFRDGRKSIFATYLRS